MCKRSAEKSTGHELDSSRSRLHTSVHHSYSLRAIASRSGRSGTDPTQSEHGGLMNTPLLLMIQREDISVLMQRI